MLASMQTWIILASVFATITGSILVVGLEFDKRRRVQIRLFEEDVEEDRPEAGAGIVERFIRRIDDGVVAVHDEKRLSKLRLQLVQAGFLSPDAPKVYFFTQAMAALALPWIGYLVLAAYSSELDDFEIVCLVGLAFLGYLGPSLFLSWRRSATANLYRGMFPDFLDLLVVCVDAGLSLNAALERVSREFTVQCPPFADNLAIFLSELRSGRSTVDGLENLSIRLNVDEARSFSMLIKQSMELGSDVGQAMRVYSDDMRVKRLLRAETTAAKLPVKMLIPLGLCIFPVILIAILTPAIIKATEVMQQSGG